ncbi:right-handed parallel beta-helix repeat-containing protein [Aquimarina sp. Aq107]|uniref:right-handed parallel beta-helix repeat-containing protein n=1 Tax=Aquimarina sp. Aq107 TaxID=1191912 RepID=UPI000D54B85F|nr:right-handed parallel beta-helix repeat-containing protein [Aquimarina sp. Aq107]
MQFKFISYRFLLLSVLVFSSQILTSKSRTKHNYSNIIEVQTNNTNYYVSPNGNDNNSGTSEDSPFATIQKAQSVAQGGDYIFLFGGVYKIQGSGQTGITLSKSGTSANPIRLWAYEDQTPVLDFSNLSHEFGVHGIHIDGNWWHLKGIEMKNAAEGSGNSAAGIIVFGSNNILELMDVHNIAGKAVQIFGSAANNTVKNCDAHHNYDPLHSGSNSDGFQAAFGSGNNNKFTGCRAWYNSDDGWDLFDMEGTTIIENCWSFLNGYIPDTNTKAGDGNGFKLGSNSTGPRHQVHFNLAAGNDLRGFDYNGGSGGMDLYNNTSYDNGFVDFRLGESLGFNVQNNIGYLSSQNVQGERGNNVSDNSWNLSVVVNNDDFISLDINQLLRSRKPDGSLPDVDYLHLKSGSDLVDKGVDLGFSFNGNAPDLGAFEAGGIQGNDEIVSVNSPDQVRPGEEVTIKVDYNAAVDRDIIVVFQKDSDDFRFFTSNTVSVAKGSGGVEVILNIPSDVPIANDAYQFSTILTTRNGGYDDRRDDLSNKDVDVVTEILLDDKITSVIAPSEVVPGEVVEISVDYSASEDSDIVIYFQRDSGDYQFYTDGRVSVTRGSGSVKIPLTIPSDVPVANDAYQFQTLITTRGGHWNERLDNLAKTNIDVISQLEDKLNWVNNPESIKQGDNLNVTVNYTASTDRDIIVIFQKDSDDFGFFTSNTISVTKGSGTVEVPLTIPQDVPVATDAYQFNTVLTTRDGGWDERKDNLAKADIDVFPSSRISEDIETFSDVEFKVLQNPVLNNELNISGPEKYNIRIYDISGKEVFKADKLQGDSRLSLKGIYRGLYLVKMTNTVTFHKKSKKIVIQ